MLLCVTSHHGLWAIKLGKFKTCWKLCIRKVIKDIEGIYLLVNESKKLIRVWSKLVSIMADNGKLVTRLLICNKPSHLRKKD